MKPWTGSPCPAQYRSPCCRVYVRSRLGVERSVASLGYCSSCKTNRIFSPVPRTQETAPHILAALEAQRARVLQQPVPTPSTSAQPTTSAAAPTPPPPPPLPGYVFDAARNRFFRMVKDPLGTPRSASKSSGVSTYNRTGTRPKIAIPIVGVRNGGYGMPPRRGGGAGLGAGARGSRKNSRSNDNDSMGSIGPYAAACGERPTVVAAVAGSAARLSRRTRGVRGLHAYAMSRRRGLCCLDSGTLGSRGGFCRGEKVVYCV